MERILRKVKCGDRMPEKEGWYAVVSSSGIHGIYWNNDWNLEDFNALKIEYWYEEVDICELDEYKMLMTSNLHLREMNNKLQEDNTKEAEERYDVAKKFIDAYHEMVGMSFYVESQVCFKALLISSGLDD